MFVHALAAVVALRCIGCDMHGQNLQGRDLHGSIYIGADMHDVNLRNADLRNVRFVGVDLSGSRLDGADLRGASFTGVDFGNASLNGARIERCLGCSFSGGRHARPGANAQQQ